MSREDRFILFIVLYGILAIALIVVIPSLLKAQSCPECWSPEICDAFNDPNLWAVMQCPEPLPEPNQPQLSPERASRLRWIAWYWLEEERRLYLSSDIKSVIYGIFLDSNDYDLVISTRGFDDPNIIIVKERINYKTFAQKFHMKGSEQ